MSDGKVIYELDLKSGTFVEKIGEAEKHASKLESTMHNLGQRVAHVAEAFGISFAIFKGIEFVHQGIEQMERLHQAEAQLQNTMENMGTFSQEAFEKMIGGAKDLSKNIIFNTNDIVELQSQLGLVGNISQSEMNRMTAVSADVATKLGMGLTEAGNLLAKAVNAPEMARRLGMALKIDPAVMAHVQALAKHGKEAEARMELLAIAESKVGGAAKAAFDADPLSRYNKIMYEIKEDVGNLATKFLKFLTPALEWVMKEFKKLGQWIKEHKDLLQALAIGVGVAAAAWGVYELVINASTIATAIMTSAQAALNAVMAASPITWILVGLAAIVTAVVYCYEHFAKFRAVLMGVWGTIKEFGRIVADIFMGLWHIIHGVFTFSLTEIKQGWAEEADAIGNAGERMGKAYKEGFDKGMEDFNKDQEKDKEALIPKKAGAPKAFPTDKVIKEPKTKATGQKSITINVQIKELIHSYSSNVTNVKESMSKMKDLVVETLTSGINDFQVVADH